MTITKRKITHREQNFSLPARGISLSRQRTPFTPVSIRRALKLFLVGLLSLGVWNACQESSVECLSERQCGPQLTCVAARCVGPEIDGDAFTLYVEEIHNRLVTECGICHGAYEGPPLTEEDLARARQGSEENTDPYRLPKLGVVPGDSGWRIYLNNLTPARLSASYDDTLQYLNLQAPEKSLLFAFGRGDVAISSTTLHPKLYPSEEEIAQVLSQDEPATEGESDPETDAGGAPLQELETQAPIGYLRLVNWSKLYHGISPEAIEYNLEIYNNGPKPFIISGCSCHGGGDPLNARERIPQGGFAFKLNPEEASDLALLSGLINLQDPPASALFRFFDQELDHNAAIPPINDQYIEAVTEWIQTLK